MKKRIFAARTSTFVASMILIMAPFVLASSARADGDTPGDTPKVAKKNCDLTFNLKGWSAIYKTAKGEGTITCDNGQTANVDIKIVGGGLTFGKSEIFNGKAEISGVRAIDDIFGSYAAAEAHAGVVKSATAQVLTKGTVSIALVGSGDGVDVGVDFSKFTISRRGAAKHKK